MEVIGRKYKNKDITVYWKPSSCIHASTCVNELPLVFRSNKKPWVRMEGGTNEEIISVVDQCPVDALTWKWNDSDKNEMIGKEHTNHIKNRRSSLLKQDNDDVMQAASINITNDGPFVVTGSFFIERENGSRSKFSGTVSICRCGGTNLPPFCDGTHRNIGFTH
jgi:uncharacterized Fe-S cluster protein YjdI